MHTVLPFFKNNNNNILNMNETSAIFIKAKDFFKKPLVQALKIIAKNRCR